MAGALEPVVQLGPFLRQTALGLPLLHQEVRQVHGGVGVGAEIQQPVHQFAGDGGLVVLEGATGLGPHPALRPAGIPGGHGPGMIDHRVHDHPDPPAVGLVHHGPQVVLRSQGGIDPRPVPGPVAVVAVGGPGALVHGPGHLLHEGRHPEGRHTQLVEPPLPEAAEHALEVAPLEAPKDRPVLPTPQGTVVGGIRVVEAVDEEEVDGPAVPGDLRIRGPVRGLLGGLCGGLHRLVGRCVGAAGADRQRHGDPSPPADPADGSTGRLPSLHPHPRRHAPAAARPSSSTGSSTVTATSSRSSTRRVRRAARTREIPPTRRA